MVLAQHVDTSELLVEAVWDDPDVIQVRASVRFGHWAGSALAYATRAQLTAFAAALDDVAGGTTSAAVAFGQRELGSADLRLYEYGGARRLGVVVRLQEPADAWRAGPADDSALEPAAPLERGALPGFAAGLRAIARDGAGTSTLALLPGWP